MASVNLLNTINSLGYSLNIPDWFIGIVALSLLLSLGFCFVKALRILFGKGE